MILGWCKRPPKRALRLSQQISQTRSRYYKILLNEAFQWAFTGLRGTASMLRPLLETALVAPSFLQRMLSLSLLHYRNPILVHDNPIVSRH